MIHYGSKYGLENLEYQSMDDFKDDWGEQLFKPVKTDQSDIIDNTLEPQIKDFFKNYRYFSDPEVRQMI